MSSKQKPSASKTIYTIDGEVMNTKSTAAALNKYFTEIGGSPSDINIRKILDNLPDHDIRVHIGQVKAWLRDIDTSKSTCSSDFPSWVTRLCSDDICVPMCNLINHCFSTGTYPDIWKQAEVVPLEKTKSAQSASDFRPISLLWNLGKVLERAIMFFYSQSVLPTIGSDQFAYQKGKSTTDAILSAVDKWTEMLDQKNASNIPVAFLDMSKAFDRMDKSKLIEMLADRGVNGRLVSVINSFLSNRRQCVRLGHEKSTILHTRNGTPQGTLLGPMFWLLYIDTLQTTSETIKYADDLTLTPRSSDNATNNLQLAIDETMSWCNAHNMIANAKKSVTMSISNTHNHHTAAPSIFRINGEPLSNQSHTRFLGVELDENLTFTHHTDHIISKTRPLLYSLIDFKRSGVPLPALKKFYETCIRPKILYACPSWYSMTSLEQRKRIKRIENMVLKVLEPNGDSYEERIAKTEIHPILDLLESTSRDYILGIINNSSHCLHHLQTGYTIAPQRRSARLSQTQIVRTRTVLRSRCPLLYYQ
jgi:gmma-aminobutyric acid receptor subunit gamma